ncbi:hypothetical protein B6N60_03525 [Richelia sinica FACHB-800]|uniref:Fido domain-containing protein n=1 Tax=Richelia sinica FACHB-800 TaxID=1357546 RepID=A0A975T9Q4_9NOST|nr:hypothetical protein [Richelia sinica]MBD2665611.1 hypothetical protein [Richelia sinica FACHB-800]QXE24816.1 hypothetical protein B6N60_03525 [Richelia sinica FACHB-800]
MHPVNCPQWEYSHYPNAKEILNHETQSILIDLRKGYLDTAKSSTDSRVVHRLLFSQLTPPEHDYFAGHYRGEDFLCLKECRVGVGGDMRVGYHPRIIIEKMDQFGEAISLGIKKLDIIHQPSEAQLSPIDKLLNTVAFACEVFVEMLTVHPYANGNGHAARFILWSILGRYGYWPVHFPIEPRPPHPWYVDCINKYRNGNKQPLEAYILQCIIG